MAKRRVGRPRKRKKTNATCQTCGDDYFAPKGSNRSKCSRCKAGTRYRRKKGVKMAGKRRVGRPRKVGRPKKKAVRRRKGRRRGRRRDSKGRFK